MAPYWVVDRTVKNDEDAKSSTNARRSRFIWKYKGEIEPLLIAPLN
jgi:hypothetical protein